MAIRTTNLSLVHTMTRLYKSNYNLSTWLFPLSMPNLTLPGFNYLGPGNPLDNGEPTNNADRIARDHDFEYSTATSPEDIRRSDRKAIIRFLGDRDLLGPSFGGTVGAIGIGAKYALESFTGVLYPSLQRTTEGKMSEKRPADTTTQEGTVKKMDSGSTHNTQTGGETSTPVTSSNVDIGGIYKMPLQNTQAHVTYKKSFMLQSESLKWRRGDHYNEAGNAIGSGDWISTTTDTMNTGYCTMDPNYPAWYMSEAEFNLLPAGSYAKGMRVRITPKGFRMPFATGDNGTNFANSDTLVQISWGVGAEYHCPAFISHVTAGTDFVSITGTTFIGNVDLAQRLYNLSGGQEDVAACYNIPRHLNHYASFLLPVHQDLNIGQYFAVGDANDLKNKPIIEYKYELKNGMLKLPNNWLPNLVKNPSGAYSGVVSGMNIPGTYTQQVNAGTVDAISPLFNATPASLTIDYYSPLEKSPVLANQVTNEQSAQCPPWIYFGGLSVQSNPVLAATPSFSSCVHTWCVETELDIVIPLSPLTVHGSIPFFPLSYYDPKTLTEDVTNYLPSLRYAGRYGFHRSTGFMAVQANEEAKKKINKISV